MMEASNFAEALVDTRQALDKIKHQQKYQKISSDVTATLNELEKVLLEQVNDQRTHRYKEETTDL